MADIDYFDDTNGYAPRGGYGDASPRAAGDHGYPDDDQGSRLGTAVNWAGALISLGLVVGMGVWAWQLTMRDVSGVPVIQALEGPMRVPPADPGGAQAPHQGLAVNRIAEGSEAEPVPDRLVLAPPPVDLEALDPPPAPQVSRDAAADDTQALIDRLVSRGQPLEGELAPPQAPPEAPAADLAIDAAAPASAFQVIPASVPGVARSLRPVTRPEALRSASLSQADTAAPSPAQAEPASGDLSIANLPPGTRLVQLGAFDSAQIARAEWDRLTGRFPDFFADRARVIQQATSGGQEFFRLRAHGFDDLAASRRFCAALVAQGAACIPVTVR
jgi:hypothetical protein